VKITDVEAMLISIPLRRPAKMTVKTWTSREYVVVRVRTDEGITGTAYTLATPAVLSTITETLRPMVVGQDPFDSELLWDRMFRGTMSFGRKGVTVRGISAIDTALWDIKGKAFGTPLYKLLGGYSRKVRAYASGGFYRQDQDFRQLAEEMAGYVQQGFEAVKVKVGVLSFKEEVERIATLRRTLGDDVEIYVDANCGWNDVTYARKIMRAFEEYNIGWFEEPVLPDNFRGSAELAAAFETPIATGEQECTRWGFRDLIEHRAADILQPDVTVVGGVSEWMKVAALASAHDLPLSSHSIVEVHVHLMAAVPNARIAEYFPPEVDFMVFDQVVQDPIVPRGGYLTPPDRPGLGMELDEKALQRFRIG